MKNSLIFFLIQVLLSQVNSQAPGDADPFCLSLSGSVSPPAYPPNSKILMDSYQYIHLLPPLPGTPAAWQQVDVDNRTSSTGARTNWFQASSFACRQRLSSCYFDTGGQDNWLISQHISRNVNGSLLPQVSVEVEFQLTGCTFGCQVSFRVEVWETSNIDKNAARDTSQYRRVVRVAPTLESSNVSQNASIPINFQSSTATGFYIAIVDENTCIALTRLIVFYHVCPEMVLDLIRYPVTLSPPINELQPRLLDGQCVDNASGELEGGNPRLSCIQGGKWGVVQEGTGCRCDDGFMHIEETEECTRCPMGEYVSPSNFTCQPCPSNTRKDVAGVAQCECLPDYFRALDENADFDCTKPPGVPTDVMIEERTATTVTMSWKAPEETGGRTDLFYRLWFQPEDGARTLGLVTNSTRGTITGLQEGTRYQFFVTAENGVSNVGSVTPMPVLVSSEFSDNNLALIIGTVVTLAAVIGLAAILLVIFLMVMLYQRRRSQSMKTTYLMESHPVVPIAIKGKRTYVDPLTYASVDDAIEEFAMEIEPKHLKLTTELGAGEFGTVYRAVWKDQGAKKQVEVAVKTLKPGSSPKARSDFLNEASIMGQFQHDHVIKLYGVITKVDPAMIIMEFMENGSLYSFLRKNDEKLNTMRLLKLARGVCSGMEYLSAVGYVHRDLAARNILLDKDEVCKVADFGLSREVVDDEYNVQKGGKIPVRWTAPEAIYRRKFTSSSDVWSFGVLLWEVMSYAQHPYDDWDNQEVLDQLETGYRLPAPYGCPASVHEVMLDCWHKELSQRPTFGEVLKRLDLLLNTESPPKRPPKKNRNSGNPSTTNPLHYKSVEEWLVSVKMERYIPIFAENGITSVNQLVHMTETDLREMGITLAGHLHKLTSSIENGYVEMKRNSLHHH